jgi:ADP-heptose:LPS heptosyltransferase
MTTKTSSPNLAWVRFRTVGYMLGRGLSFGLGAELFPRAAVAPGKYSLNVDILPNPSVAVCGEDISVFGDGVFDHVAVGPRLGYMAEPARTLAELVRKLKQGGHLILILPLNDTSAPWQFDDYSVAGLLAPAGAFRIKATYVRDGQIVWIVKKVAGKRGTLLPERPRAAKRACIVRYGALGDMVMITPLIRKLAEEGYEVTMNITPYALPVLENNPHVSNIILQEREAIPNKDLGPYWTEWQGEYDKYINLSESIEGKLLKVEGRRDFYTGQEWRNRTCGGTNYYDFTMALGGYPEITGQRGELYLSPQEERDAKRWREQNRGKFTIMWAMNGSSHHKVYPLAEIVASDWLEKHPDARIVTVGDGRAQQLEWEHPQVECASGVWPVRKSMALTKYVDCVIGPESMIINCAGCWDTSKIVLLSHSTPNNLCKYFTNVQALTPSTDVAPCYPCHQLHYTLNSCPQLTLEDIESGEKISGPACSMGAITPEAIWQALDAVYAAWKDKHVVAA